MDTPHSPETGEGGGARDHCISNEKEDGVLAVSVISDHLVKLMYVHEILKGFQ